MFERSVEAIRFVRAGLEDVASALPAVIRDAPSMELSVDDHRGVALRVAVKPALGVASADGGAICWPLSWAPVGHTHLLPAFTGSIEALDLGGDTRLALRGTYEPPMGILGAVADKLKLHELAGESIDAFMRALGRAIDDAVDLKRAGPMRVADYPADLRRGNGRT
jgi:hypothetical protein